MSTNSYFFHPNGGGIKQGFLMENEAGTPVYEAKVLKMPLFGAATVEFIDHTTGRSEEHKIGHTATIEHENGGIFDAFSTKSYYKYDGVKIWDYLHEKGVRLDTHMSSGHLGFTWPATLRGRDLAVLSSASAKNNPKALLTTRYALIITTPSDTPEDLALIFLIAFSIARTDQTFLN